jgi:hypothetical protein
MWLPKKLSAKKPVIVSRFVQKLSNKPIDGRNAEWTQLGSTPPHNYN